MLKKINRIVNFDYSEFPFKNLIIKSIEDYLGRHITKVSLLHKMFKDEDLKGLYNHIYLHFRSSDFQRLYDIFCYDIIKKYFGGEADFQSIPSVRIQFPNMKTVNFHNDVMYGHGNDIINVWIPITKVQGKNSLHVLNKEDSKRVINIFKNQELSLLDLNEICTPLSKPLNMNFGQYFIFNTWILHGTFNNNLDQTRISFDMRFLPKNSKHGLKDRSFFIQNRQRPQSLKSQPASIYMHNYVGYTKFIATNYQSIICQRYAENNNFNVIVEETEIRTVAHQPNLHDMCFGTYKGKFKIILMISILLLPENNFKRKNLLKMVQKSDLELHFVLDDVIFNSSGSIEDIMNKYILLSNQNS